MHNAKQFTLPHMPKAKSRPIRIPEGCAKDVRTWAEATGKPESYIAAIAIREGLKAETIKAHLVTLKTLAGKRRALEELEAATKPL